MKSLRFSLAVVLALIVAVFAAAQTKIQPGSINSNGLLGKVMVIDATGHVVYADLGSGLTLDTSGARPVLKAAAPALNRLILTATAATGATLNLSPVPTDPTSVLLHRNGVLLSVGIDYSITGGVVSLVPEQALQTGDIVNVAWQ